MSRIKSIKIQGENGNFSSNIPIGADAVNIDMQDGTDVEEKIGLIQHDIIVDSRRLDAIEAGDTSSGDEVVGIRTAVNGTVYANAGTAVRQQVKQITRSTPIVDENDIYKIKHYRYDTGGSVEPPITLDASLSVAGAAADAKATGDEISELREITDELKNSGLSIDQAQENQVPIAKGDGTWEWGYEAPNIIPNHLPVNCEYAATKIGNAALSYILHKDEFIYDGRYSAIRDQCIQVDGKWGLTCSIFAILLVFGVSYENSAFKRGSGNNILDPDCCPDIEMWDWFRTNWPGRYGDYQYKYTYDLAEWCYNRGYCFKPNRDLSNIRPGDLLFMKNQLTYDHPSTFMDIDHSCVFAYWKNNNMYKVWEVGVLPDEASYFRENLEENCVLVARFPYGQKDTEYRNLSFDYGPFVSGNAVIGYISIKKLIPDRYYTFIVKMTWDKSIEDAWPAVYQQNDRVGMCDGATEKPEDDIYIIPFIPRSSVALNLRLIFNPDSDVRSATSRVEWFQIVEGLHFSKEKISGDRHVLITLNSGFTTHTSNRQNGRYTYGISGTFPAGVTTVGEVSYFIRHGPYVPLINTTFVDGVPVDGITAYLDYQNMNKCYLKVKNSTGADVTGFVYCIIPVYEY